MSQIAPVIAKVSFLSQLNKQQKWYHFSRRRRCLNVGTTDPNLYLSKEQYRLFRTGGGRCCLAETVWFPKLYSGSSLSFQLGRRRQFSELSSSSLPSSLSPPTTETISQTTRTRINFNHSENIPSSSASTLQDDRPSSHYNHQQENSIDKFTHFALNSHMIPLGSMEEEMWNDILDAIDGWLNIGGGFAIDSAERLLDRLINEHAVSFSEKKSNSSAPSSSSYYAERSIVLVDLQRHGLNSWINAFHVSQGNSKMALSRAEQAMFRLLDLQSALFLDSKTIQSTFPVEEYFVIIDGYLNLNSHVQLGTEKAGHLLLRLMSDNDDRDDVRNLDLNITAKRVGLLFEKCVSQLHRINSRHDMIIQLLETMTHMKESGLCPSINLPDIIDQIPSGYSLQQQRTPENNNLVVGSDTSNINTTEMSPFELEIAEKRLISVLKYANEEEKDTIMGLIQSLTKIKPSNELVVTLLNYYIRIKDVENASQWLQRLEPSYLISSYNLVESVLESWLEQKGPKAPWRADEVFKAVTSKIRQHDEIDTNKKLSRKSLNLILDIWMSSKDPSASKKIVDWYSQMKSWTIKPTGSILKMMLQALQTEKVDSPLELISAELLEQWDDFGKDEKIEIANTVLVLISFQRDSFDTVTKFIDQFYADKIIPAKKLFRLSISAIRMDHEHPSDVIKIVNSLGCIGEDVVLSLYTLAIVTLFKFDGDTRSEIQSVYEHALKVITLNRNVIDSEDISEFLYVVIAMHVNRKLYSEAGSYLQKAEMALLSTTDSTEKLSPIPLKCYKKMIIRKWYTSTTAQRVEALFERLLSLHMFGYTNLQPDCDLHTAYINARAASGKEVEHNLEEIIKIYKENEDEALLPQTKVFNTVLLSLAQKKRNISGLHNKSISLLTRMVNLGVQPDIKTFNLVLQNIVRGNKKKAYGIMLELIEKIEKNELTYDSHTLHLIIDACGSALPNERDSALKKSLSSLGEIRQKGFVGPITYGILSKAAYQLLSRDVRADKVGQSILTLCCKDGMLNSEVRGRLRSMMSNGAWDKVYEIRLSRDKREPDEWSRNTHKTPE